MNKHTVTMYTTNNQRSGVSSPQNIWGTNNAEYIKTLEKLAENVSELLGVPDDLLGHCPIPHYTPKPDNDSINTLFSSKPLKIPRFGIIAVRKKRIWNGRKWKIKQTTVNQSNHIFKAEVV